MNTSEVQAALLSLGYSLTIDGVACPKTRTVIQAFGIDEIIIHCTATPESRDVSVETIRGWHIGQGWKDIGYHWAVMLDGIVRPGRPEAKGGSDVANHNTGTLGVAYVGGVDTQGYPKDTRTPAQKGRTLLLQCCSGRGNSSREVQLLPSAGLPAPRGPSVPPNGRRAAQATPNRCGPRIYRPLRLGGR
ncbi:MAG TPA: hypothetical protein VGN82_08120 [Bosea sp. (in: a-proteobacteria)]|jgi:N-acetylmuramoyl-L-alanine amidase|uniref:hypothetical protein n=1 Tax=Bosea sp. (in: a-proteobacteria) TaxID=1871050 RepID=UPI002E0F5D43|nr:hypothetical protein [Bosea sp. (in: a-proteobacteria)]